MPNTHSNNQPMPQPILAIDPGSEQSGFLWYDPCQRRPLPPLLFGFGIDPNHELLIDLRNPPMPALLVVEMVGHYGKGMPAGKSIFDTCIWIGRFIEAWPYEHRLILRATVKAHVCGTARAKDSNIRQALLDRYGGTRQAAIGTKKAPGPLYGVTGHVWAALALAVTAAEDMTP